MILFEHHLDNTRGTRDAKESFVNTGTKQTVAFLV